MILDLPVERWRLIEPLLDQLLALPPTEHQDLLDTACDGDLDLRAAVKAFLAADEAAGGFLDTPAGEYAVDLFDEEGIEDLLEGQQIGPYLLVREIGSGGMGVVYEAKHSRLHRRVAIKLLPPEYSRDRRAKERFLREAQAMSCLDHPSLCTVYDFGESDGRLYIVLAYYEGETLKERLRQGPLPVAEAREVAIQLARGLACAHEAGIIHRDIKPANVMVTRRGEAKILDFGVAKQGGEDVSLTPTGASWGTPAYMSPEQVRGEPVDVRTDVWSLGVVLYEMLAGRRPFGGDGVQSVLASILTCEPAPLRRLRPDVPPELARLVERALAKNPAERSASALELLADLEAGQAPRALPRLRRLRRMKALPAALVTAAVLALLFATWSLGWLRSFAAPAAKPRLRVAVLKPELVESGVDPQVSSFAAEVVDATLVTFLSLEGIEALDPPEFDEKRGSALERARASEADEVLSPRLQCQDGWCKVAWRRSKPGGEFLGMIGPVDGQAGLENAQQFAEAVRAELPKAYEGHPLRPDAPRNRVRPEDYAGYIELERQFDRRGFRLGPAELERLDSLLETSPDLSGAYLLAGGIAHSLGAPYRERALAYATRAEEIAPHDPRPLLARVLVEVAGRRLTEAQTTLERLVQLAPTDARVASAKAELLEARGELKAARVLREQVAQRRPHWRNTLDLVRLEFRMGEGKSARRRLDELLRMQPGNVYALENLAAVEIVFGDPKRAVAIYQKLIDARPTDQCWANLGFAHFVLGDFIAAEEAFHRALKLNPKYPLPRFNLAAVLEAQGDAGGARQLCRTLVREFAAEPTQLGPTLGLLDAQCLTRLGNHEAAARLADQVFEQWPEEEVQFFFRAAQLYALLGKRSSAIHYAGMALRRGLRPEWFTFPEFRALQKDPELRALLDSAGQRASEIPASPR